MTLILCRLEHHYLERQCAFQVLLRTLHELELAWLSLLARPLPPHLLIYLR